MPRIHEAISWVREPCETAKSGLCLLTKGSSSMLLISVPKTLNAIRQIENLIGVTRGETALVSSLVQFVNDWFKKRYMRRIIQIDPYFLFIFIFCNSIA
jgi:hypothetical protein